MTFEAWLTFSVLMAAVAAMATDRLPPPYAVLSATTILLVAGVIDAGQALSGFSNPAPITVAALYVLAAAAEKTGTLDRLPALLASGSSARGVLTRLLLPTAAASSVLNNTPIVAIVAPVILAWARRTGQSASRFLIPVSFAAILGGLLTLIGTSTNLIVSGLLEAAGYQPLGLFEIGRIGLPVALAGIGFIVLLGPRLLPERRAPGQDLDTDAREFVVEMLVAPGSPLIGRSIGAAGLRNLEGVFLVELVRHGQPLPAVSPSEPLVEGDRLTFAGNVARIVDLQRIPGLVSAEERHFPHPGEVPRRRVFEAVVANGSTLVGVTLKEIGFRARYGAAVLAIHRAGERLRTKLGDVRLKPGDLLLVLAGDDFRLRWREYRDFLVVAAVGRGELPRRDKSGVVVLVIGALLVTVGTGLLDILQAALLTAFGLVAFRVLSPAEARSAVDLNVIIVIAGSFGLGAALTTSGLAAQLATTFIWPLGRWGDVGLLAGVLIATLCLTELVTNNAAAVLMFPIALATATQAGLDPRPLAIAVALGASSSFLSPIGYQTNTMVYAMGGYRFTDFARLGAGLTVLVVILVLLLLPGIWPLR